MIPVLRGRILPASLQHAILQPQRHPLLYQSLRGNNSSLPGSSPSSSNLITGARSGSACCAPLHRWLVSLDPPPTCRRWQTKRAFFLVSRFRAIQSPVIHAEAPGAVLLTHQNHWRRPVTVRLLDYSLRCHFVHPALHLFPLGQQNTSERLIDWQDVGVLGQRCKTKVMVTSTARSTNNIFLIWPGVSLAGLLTAKSTRYVGSAHSTLSAPLPAPFEPLFTAFSCARADVVTFPFPPSFGARHRSPSPSSATTTEEGPP
ncbi:hypothetical protein O3P69_007724 [Scylla paramamosain]|uniref:Uncharacterized protein n=1 Tax=Scylla paramamosain TaxID=85552 RepID=A0AAW0UX14_SCYPA